MDNLVLIFKELCVIAGIIFMLLVICSMILTPFQNAKKEKEQKEIFIKAFNELLKKELDKEEDEK